MILFTILLVTAILLILFVIFAVSIGGAATIIVFGDVIVCIGIIVGIIVLAVKKRKK